MTDKPSQWALEVWRAANFAEADAPAKVPAHEAAALIIEQARAQWERELCEWLAEVPWPYRNDALITAISRGEHRKGK